MKSISIYSFYKNHLYHRRSYHDFFFISSAIDFSRRSRPIVSDMMHLPQPISFLLLFMSLSNHQL